MSSLRGTAIKLARAREQLKMLEAEYFGYCTSDPIEVTCKTDPQTKAPVFIQRQIKDIPYEIPLLIGEIAHNLRCAIDYLVYQLVLVADKTPTDRNAFPITDHPDHFKSAVNKQLAGVDVVAVAAIERLQPYHAGDRSKIHPLWVLAKLTNLDKHRMMPVAVCRNLAGQIKMFTRGETFVSPIESGSNDGAIIGVGPVPIKGGQEVRVQAQAPISIVIDYEAIREIDCRVLFATIEHFISKTVTPQIAQFFKD